MPEPKDFTDFISCRNKQVKYGWLEGLIPGKMNPGGRGKVLNPRAAEDPTLIHGLVSDGLRL